MFGGRSGSDVATFWQHCFQHEEWKNHPAKYLAGVVKERSFPAMSVGPTKVSS